MAYQALDRNLALFLSHLPSPWGQCLATVFADRRPGARRGDIAGGISRLSWWTVDSQKIKGLKHLRTADC